MKHCHSGMRAAHRLSRCSLVLSLVALAAIATTTATRAQLSSPAGQRRLFADVAARAGVDHRHHKPILDAQLDNVMSWMTSVGAAAAAADYNRDGRLDLFVTDSLAGQPNRLYRNNGDGTFTDVASEAGVAGLNDREGVAMDCAWGDVDGDGWPDLYIVRWGRDLLLRNNGNGTFRDITAERFRRADGSPGTDWKNGNAVLFFDYDLDGRLDLYVGNYFPDVDLWDLESTRIMHDSFETARNAGRNQLFHQEKDGRFVERAVEAGVDDPGWTLAVGSADLDQDGWPDLYAANDFGPDQLFLNRRDGTFANVTEQAMGFDTKKGMNVDFGDVNNDGWLDIYVTNITTPDYLQEGNMLWLSNGVDAEGNLSFTDIAFETGTDDGGWGWGAEIFDADNDGDGDIFAANGFISAGEGNYWYDLASWTVTEQDPADSRNWPAIGERSFSGFEKKRFFRNQDGASFIESATEVGLDSESDGRGVVVFDYDNDGDLDLFLANQGQHAQLFENRGVPGHHWLTVELEIDPKTGVHPDGLGTRVTITTAAGSQIRQKDGGKVYAGQGDPRLHFGLGAATLIDALVVRWPDGGIQELGDLAVDRILHLRQDPARYVRREPAKRDPREIATRAVGSERASGPVELPPQLTELEARLSGGERAWSLGYRYRALAVEQNRLDRAISFLESLVAAHPADVALRIELGSAYVDKIPSCGGLAAVICKGKLARRSLDQFDAALAVDPNSWVTLYSRGINHLHWPRALRHADDSAADLARAAELQERAAQGPRGGRQPAWALRTYVALGDAHVKNGAPALARQAWERGLAAFPGSPELAERLAIHGDRELLSFVESRRSLERPIDTDLSFLEDRTP